MTLREFCKNKIESSLFRLSLIFLIVSLLFSTSIYLKKAKIALNEDLRKIEIIRFKINRAYEIKKDIEKISAPQFKNPQFLVAQLLDSFNSKFPETKIELSQSKKEGKEVIFPFSINGVGSFKRYADIVYFLEQDSYPASFINLVSLKVKENAIDFTIKGEFRLISHDSQI